MKNVLVTGSTGTLGEEILRLLLKNNYNVIGHYNKNWERAYELEKELGIEFIKCDLTNENDIDNMVNYLINKYGKIIYVASTNRIDTYYPESIDYDTSKAGLINLTKNLAKYYAPYICVNAIAPGWIETKDTLNMDESFIKEEKEKILLNRFGIPYEIARSILFLCENDYIDGEVIRIDGGIR